MPTTTNIRFDAVTDTVANIATDDYQGRMGYASDAPGGSGTWRINYDGVNIAYLARRNAANTWDAGTQTFTDSVFRLADGGDTTKLLAFELSGLTTATTRTITIPDASGTILLDGSSSISVTSEFVLNLPSSGVDGYIKIQAASVDTYQILFSNAATGDPRVIFQTAAGVEHLKINSFGIDAPGVYISGSIAIDSSRNATLAKATASSSGGFLIEANGGTDVALFGAGGGAGSTFYGQINGTAIQLSSLTTGRLPTIGASGLIGNDAGWTYTQTSSVTTTVKVGDGSAAATVAFIADAASDQVAGLSLRSVGTSRWSVARLATSLDFAIIARDSGGAEIDQPINIPNAALGVITIGGGGRPTNFNAEIRVGGTAVISAARAVTCTSLAITGATQFQIPYVQSGGTTITTNASFTFNGTKLSVPASTASNASLNIPTGTAPSSPAAGDVWHDSTTKSTATYSNAITGYVSRCIYSQYAATTQTGIVTNQTLSNASARGTRTLPANFLNVQGKRLRYYLCGVYTTDASAGNAEIRIRIGSTTFRTTGTFGLDNSITNGWWRLTGELSCYTTGATGTLAGTMAWEHQASSLVGSEVMHLQPATTTGAVTVDLTASNAFNVDWTASDAGTSITCTCFALYEEA